MQQRFATSTDEAERHDLIVELQQLNDALGTIHEQLDYYRSHRTPPGKLN